MIGMVAGDDLRLALPPAPSPDVAGDLVFAADFADQAEDVVQIDLVKIDRDTLLVVSGK